MAFLIAWGMAFYYTITAISLERISRENAYSMVGFQFTILTGVCAGLGIVFIFISALVLRKITNDYVPLVQAVHS